MKEFSTIFEFSRLAILSLALTANTSSLAQKQAEKGAEPQFRLEIGRAHV